MGGRRFRNNEEVEMDTREWLRRVELQISTALEFCTVYHAGPNASMFPGIIVKNKHNGVLMISLTSLYICITFGTLLIEHTARIRHSKGRYDY